MMNITYTFKTISAGLGVMALALIGDAQTNPAHASCTPAPYLGTVCLTAANFCPVGYMRADGALIKISENPGLFSLLGTTYGGDGRVDFGLPDLRGRSVLHEGKGRDLSPFKRGDRVGKQFTNPSVESMALHTHNTVVNISEYNHIPNVKLYAATGEPSDLVKPSKGAYIGITGDGFSKMKSFVTYEKARDLVELGGIEVTSKGPLVAEAVGAPAGGSRPFSNRPPQLVMLYCVATRGEFPQRP
ncbi:tail fiber protein [Magnetovibrio sp. PR-2]|uniref:phage tail protein n=1 Tax=Magnetovibrio sp. PR-2 TaxID=3120356 RepID=UPI002FCE2E41